MAIEYAKNTHKGKRPIEDVPAFRQHLARRGLRNLAEWEARQRQESSADEASLALQARYVRAMARARQ